MHFYKSVTDLVLTNVICLEQQYSILLFNCYDFITNNVCKNKLVKSQNTYGTISCTISSTCTAQPMMQKGYAVTQHPSLAHQNENHINKIQNLFIQFAEKTLLFIFTEITTWTNNCSTVHVNTKANIVDINLEPIRHIWSTETWS